MAFLIIGPEEVDKSLSSLNSPSKVGSTVRIPCTSGSETSGQMAGGKV